VKEESYSSLAGLERNDLGGNGSYNNITIAQQHNTAMAVCVNQHMAANGYEKLIQRKDL